MERIGPYLVVRPLGSGRITDAFEAKSVGAMGFEKHVALKVLRAEHLGRAEELVARTKRWLRLSHANIVQLIDLEPTADTAYIVTELVAGVSLPRLLSALDDARAPLDAKTALLIVAELFKALDHAHRRKGGAVVHGNVAPSNVFVTWEGEIKLDDFTIGVAPSTMEATTGDDVRAALDILTALSSDPTIAPFVAELRERSDLSLAAAGVHERVLAEAYKNESQRTLRDLGEMAQRICRERPPSPSNQDKLESFLSDAAEARPSERAPHSDADRSGGELREATIFVARFADPTDEARQEATKKLLARAGATLLELDATELHALFGVVRSDGRDVEAAANAALELLAQSPDAMVGLDIDRVVVRDDEVVRDVNLGQARARAALLSSSAAPATAIASAAAASALSGTFEMHPGKSGAQLVRPLDPLTTSARFVGRAIELKQLSSWVATAISGRATSVLVVGPAGVGKSRLCAEIGRRVARTGLANSSWVSAHAFTPESFLLDLARHLLGVRALDEPGRARETNLALQTLGLPTDSTMEGLITSNVGALVRVAKKVSADRHLIVFLDGIDTLPEAPREELLAGLRAGEVAMTLVASAREPRRGFEHTLTVPPLSDEETASLVAARFGARLLSPEIIGAIAERTENRPLYIEQLCRDLVNGARARVENGILKANIEGPNLPRSYLAAIEGNLAHLEPRARGCLRLLGTMAPHPATLEALVSIDASTTRADVDALGVAGFTRETRDGVSLVSSVIADVVLAALSLEERRALHEKIAESLQLHEDASRLERAGHHYLAAGRNEDAARAFLQAGKAATVRRFGASATLRGLALGGASTAPSEELCAMLEEIARTSVESAVAGQASEASARAIERIDAIGTPEERTRVRISLARIMAGLDAHEEARVLLSQAESIAPAPLVGVVQVEIVRIAERGGDLNTARETAKHLDDVNLQDPVALADVAIVEALFGAATRAEERLSVAYQRASLGSAEERLRVETRRARVLLLRSDFPLAARTSLLATDLARLLDVEDDLIEALLVLAEAWAETDHLDRSYATAVEASERAEGSQRTRPAIRARAWVAYLDARRNPNLGAHAAKALSTFASQALAAGFVSDALEIETLAARLSIALRGTEEGTRALEAIARRAFDLGYTILAERARLFALSR